MKVIQIEPANYIRLTPCRFSFYVKLSKHEKIHGKGIDKPIVRFYNDGIDSKGAVGIFLRRLFYFVRFSERNTRRHCWRGIHNQEREYLL